MEDFLTEIVADCWRRNSADLVGWLRQIGATAFTESVTSGVYTQQVCPPDELLGTGEKIPDVVIHLTDGRTTELIFVECKVGSPLWERSLNSPRCWRR